MSGTTGWVPVDIIGTSRRLLDEQPSYVLNKRAHAVIAYLENELYRERLAHEKTRRLLLNRPVSEVRSGLL